MFAYSFLFLFLFLFRSFRCSLLAVFNHVAHTNLIWRALSLSVCVSLCLLGLFCLALCVVVNSRMSGKRKSRFHVEQPKAESSELPLLVSVLLLLLLLLPFRFAASKRRREQQMGEINSSVLAIVVVGNEIVCAAAAQTNSSRRRRSSSWSS